MQRPTTLSKPLCVLLALLGLSACPALAQPAAPGAAIAPAADAPMFSLLPEFTPAQLAQPSWIRARKYQALSISQAAVARTLADAPLEDTPKAAQPLIVFLPTPDGVYQRFAVVESPIMEPGLAAQFPDIKTYRGQGIDDPWAMLRMDYTPQGFHAQVLTPSGEGAWYIDPFTDGDTVLHSSYYRADLRRSTPWFCGFTGGDDLPVPNIGLRGGVVERPSGSDLSTFRLAVAATGEYTAFHGGTVALGQAAIVTAVNRVTGVYEREVAVRFVLVANNSSLVYTSTSDPYTNGNGGTMLSQNQSNVDLVIGSANYDIGHVFSTGGGGVAQLGVVCSAGSKAYGVTGSTAPIGDAFWIDYVAHEMGHQFGGNHTFNSTTSSCGGGNRSGNDAYEPGSGSTIMAYAGICGSDDLQPNSDAYFHTNSYDEIRAHVESRTCRVVTTNGNSTPTVNAGSNYTIPRGTPFTLTATGTDANGDALTYCWEEFTLGAAQALTAADNGTSPIDRSRPGTTSPSRTIPALTTILSNTVDNEEKLPNAARTSWPWRCTIRDNRSGGGGVTWDDAILTVSGTAGPFLVTYPNSAVSVSGPINVTWDVANTNLSPVNCANVKISLSTDNGFTFPTVLVASTPNDGVESVLLPNITTGTARLKIEAVGNIFFDISNTNFSITPVPSVVTFTSGGAAGVTDASGNGNANSVAEPGEDAIVLALPVRNAGAITGTGVTGTLSSLTATATVVTAVSAYPDLPFNTVGNNLSPLVISISPSHPCGAPVNVRLTMASAEGSGTVDFSIPVGVSIPGSAQTFFWAGNLSITDGATAGVNATVTVSGLNSIADLDFRFNGTSCGTSTASTTVGLTHGFVGDLVVRLTSPQGTTVTFINRPGSGSTGSSGNNFCQTILDDESGGTSIDAIVTSGAPYSNSYLPQSPFSAFDGQNPNGVWTLNVADVLVGTAGTLRAFAIVITPAPLLSCESPITSTGACCLTSGACTITVGAGACSGAYRGDGTTCPPSVACEQPTTCCLADGSCTVIPVGGTCEGTVGDGSTCPPTIPCPPPTGACCAADGSCTLLTVADCNALSGGGAYQGNSVACTPTLCPQPVVGACCQTDGSCLSTTEAQCSVGIWSNNTCTPTFCPQPLQNCCRGTTCVPVAAGSCVGSVAGSSSVTFASCGTGNTLASCCYADFDHNGTSSVDDLFLFLNAWFTSSPYAKFGGDTVASPAVDDLFLFLNGWFTGCAP